MLCHRAVQPCRGVSLARDSVLVLGTYSGFTISSIERKKFNNQGKLWLTIRYIYSMNVSRNFVRHAITSSVTQDYDFHLSLSEVNTHRRKLLAVPPGQK